MFVKTPVGTRKDNTCILMTAMCYPTAEKYSYTLVQATDLLFSTFCHLS